MKKTLTMVLAFALVFALGVGGTLAWLTAETTEVVNTFTVGDINIELKEHKLNADNKTLSETLTNPAAADGNNYDYVPGDTLPKDPFVTVKANSEACWLFVKIDVANNTNNNIEGDNKNVINWAIASGWTPVTEGSNIYYREVAATGENDTDPMYVLANNNVTVNENVTKDMVTGLNTNKPTLTFKAAAVQKDNIADVATALTKVQWQ